MMPEELRVCTPNYRTDAGERGVAIAKYTALGNCYLVLDPAELVGGDDWLERTSDGDLLPHPSRVETLCNLEWGIGSNGLLYGPRSAAHNNAFELSIFNSDGTSAGLSGNGIRIFARYLIDAGYVERQKSMEFSIFAVLYSKDSYRGREALAEALVTILDADSCLLRVSLRSMKFGLASVAGNAGAISQIRDGNGSFEVAGLVEIARKLKLHDRAWSDSSLVNIGNDHCCTFVADVAFPQIVDLKQVSDELEKIAYEPGEDVKDATFTRGANLHWAHVASRARIRLSVFERGEGPTASSGSCACAAALCAYRRGLIDDKCEVEMSGGVLLIELSGSPLSPTGVALIGYADPISRSVKIDATDLDELVAKRRGAASRF